MKKGLSVLLCILTLFACSFGLSGCLSYTSVVYDYLYGDNSNPYPYRGAYKELYTTAIYSIPDSVGYMDHGEGAFEADIYVWEQDDYGRTLFSYCDDLGNRIFGLVISQAYDENNVYFYPDVNYALTLLDFEHQYGSVSEDHLKNRTEALYLEAKEKLKEANDWNKPLDKSKCVSYPITDHKAYGENTYELTADQCTQIINDYTDTLNLPNPDDDPRRIVRALQADADGRVLHEIFAYLYYDNPSGNKNDPETCYRLSLWVITDPNGNYDKENGVLVMYSKANESDSSFIYDPQDLAEFKSQNNWVNPYYGQ